MVDGAALMLTPFYGARGRAASGASGAPTCSTPARRSTRCTRPPTASWWPSARSSRSSTPSCSSRARPRRPTLAAADDRANWPALKKRFAEVFRTEHARRVGARVFDGTDACVAPVLTPAEAPDHPHNLARGTFLELRGVPAARARAPVLRAPRPTRPRPRAPGRVAPTRLWRSWGFDGDDVAARSRGPGAWSREGTRPCPSPNSVTSRRARGILAQVARGKLARRPTSRSGRSAAPRSPASPTRRCSSTPRGREDGDGTEGARGAGEADRAHRLPRVRLRVAVPGARPARPKTDVPVPTVRWFEADPTWLGAPFFVMGRSTGRVPADSPPYTVEGWIHDEATPEQRRTLVESGLDALVKIHALDWRALGLDFLDKPQYGELGIEQQIRYYERAFEWAAEGGSSRSPGRRSMGEAPTADRRPRDHGVLGRRPHQQPAVRAPATTSRRPRLGDGHARRPDDGPRWWLFLDRHFHEGMRADQARHRTAGFP